MKYTCLRIIALLALPILVSAQSKCDCFNRLYHLSNYYRDRNDTTNAISALRDAISFLDEDNKVDYYWTMAERYGSYGQFDSSVTYYTKAVLNSGSGLDRVKQETPVAFAAMDTQRIARTMADQMRNIDLDYYSKFISGYAIDQGLRGDLMTSAEMWDTTAPVKKLVQNIFYRSDSMNFELVKMTLEKYGIPTFRKLGFPPDHFGTFIIHLAAYNNGWGDYIFNKLAALNAACDFPDKSYILFLMDRQKNRLGQKTIAGLTGYPHQYLEIQDINKADSIRLSYNYLRIKDIAGPEDKVPADYKPRTYPANYFCLKKYQIK